MIKKFPLTISLSDDEREMLDELSVMFSTSRSAVVRIAIEELYVYVKKCESGDD